MTARPRGRLLVVLGLALAALIGAGVLIVLAATREQPPAPQVEPPPRGASPSAQATAASPPGTPPATALADGERTLLARLSSFELTNCQGVTAEAIGPVGGPTDVASAGVTAALRCVPGVAAAGQPPATVVVLGYADSAATARDAARRSTAIVDVGACASGETSSEAYLLPSRRSGTFLCEAAPGRFTTYWTIDRERVGFLAESGDPAGLIAWWRSFDPL